MKEKERKRQKRKKKKNRLSDRGDLGPLLEHVAHVAVHEGLVGHLLDVGTCGEGSLAAGQHDGSHVGVLVQLLAGGVDVRDEGVVEGVEGLGSVERDDAHPVLDVHEDVLVAGREGSLEEEGGSKGAEREHG